MGLAEYMNEMYKQQQPEVAAMDVSQYPHEAFYVNDQYADKFYGRGVRPNVDGMDYREPITNSNRVWIQDHPTRLDSPDTRYDPGTYGYMYSNPELEKIHPDAMHTRITGLSATELRKQDEAPQLGVSMGETDYSANGNILYRDFLSMKDVDQNKKDLPSQYAEETQGIKVPNKVPAGISTAAKTVYDKDYIAKASKVVDAIIAHEMQHHIQNEEEFNPVGNERMNNSRDARYDSKSKAPLEDKQYWNNPMEVEAREAGLASALGNKVMNAPYSGDVRGIQRLRANMFDITGSPRFYGWPK